MPNPDAVYDVLVRETMCNPAWRSSFNDWYDNPTPDGRWWIFASLVYDRDTGRVETTRATLVSRRMVARTNAALAALEGGDA